MNTIEVETHARRLMEEYGVKAMAVAAQKARALEEQGEEEQAQTWRRIEAHIAGKRGAPES